MAKSNIDWLVSINKEYLFSEKLSDVKFDFGEGKLLHAHAHHLAFVSEVFETQLFGAMKERRIKIKDATFENFQTFLRFIYTGELQLTLDNMFQLAYLGKKYMINKVAELVSAFFMTHTGNDTYFWKLFRPKEIVYFDNEQKDCLAALTRHFDENPLAYFGTEQFLSADVEIIAEIVRNGKLAVKELDLYKAVLRWAEHQCKGRDRSRMRKVVEPFVHSLRLPTLTWSELTSVFGNASSELLLPEEKKSLLCYNGGIYDFHMPFIKIPRKCSRDVLVASAKGRLQEYTSTSISTSFVPQAAYRIVGVTCELASPSDSSILICFELVKLNQETQDEESVCIFKYNGAAKSTLLFCPVGELYPLHPNTTYTLSMALGPDVSIRLCTGGFSLGTGTRCVQTNDTDKHAIQSLSLLPV